MIPRESVNQHLNFFDRYRNNEKTVEKFSPRSFYDKNTTIMNQNK